jgi:hypothetical protein
MNTDPLDLTAEADLDEIVQSLTSMCLGMDARRIAPVELELRAYDQLMTAWVLITGAWHGAVAVSCMPGLARRAASAMFGTEGQVADDEARDALREIANIIGGNFKSLVSSPSRLSLPVLRDHAPGTSGLLPVHRVWFDCEGEVLLVTVQPQPGPSGSVESEPG